MSSLTGQARQKGIRSEVHPVRQKIQPNGQTQISQILSFGDSDYLFCREFLIRVICTISICAGVCW